MAEDKDKIIEVIRLVCSCGLSIIETPITDMPGTLMCVNNNCCRGYVYAQQLSIKASAIKKYGTGSSVKRV